MLGARALQLIAGQICRMHGSVLGTRFGRGRIRQTVREERVRVSQPPNLQAPIGGPAQAYAMRVQGSEPWEPAGGCTWSDGHIPGEDGTLPSPGEWDSCRTRGQVDAWVDEKRVRLSLCQTGVINEHDEGRNQRRRGR